MPLTFRVDCFFVMLFSLARPPTKWTRGSVRNSNKQTLGMTHHLLYRPRVPCLPRPPPCPSPSSAHCSSSSPSPSPSPSPSLSPSPALAPALDPAPAPAPSPSPAPSRLRPVFSVSGPSLLLQFIVDIVEWAKRKQLLLIMFATNDSSFDDPVAGPTWRLEAGLSARFLVTRPTAPFRPGDDTACNRYVSSNGDETCRTYQVPVPCCPLARLLATGHARKCCSVAFSASSSRAAAGFPIPPRHWPPCPMSR